MSNKKTTKRALLLSVIALFICVSMLAGTTFAWFTDSVTSGKNVIVAGNLDVELTHTNAVVTDATVEGSTNLFVDKNGDAILWEPGVVVWENFTVSNVGTLALKYQYQLTKYSEVANGDKSLEDVIKVGYTTNTTATSREDVIKSVDKWINISDIADAGELAPGASATDRIVLYWAPTDHDNDYNMNNANQGKVLSIEFGLTLVATQNTVEVDSFDELYDKDATYPTVVETAADFATAIAEGGEIVLAKDLVVDSKITIPAGKEVSIDLGGNTLGGVFATAGTSAVIDNQGTLELTNGTVVSLAEHPDTDWNPEGFPTYATNTISNRGNLVIGEGMVVENQTNVGGASYAIDNYAGGSLTINEGAVIKAKDIAIRLNTASATAANNVVINGGTITGKRAIWIQLAGSNSAVAPVVNLTINGGTFTSTSDFTLYSYSYGNSFANTTVNLNGGTFEKYVAFGGGYKGDTETVNVTGGTFTAGIGRYDAGDVWQDIVY